MLYRLTDLTTHDTLILLRNSVSATRLLHILRCCPCADHPELTTYDAELRSGLSMILNLPLTDEAWIQASLPIKRGGLGIRSVTSLALPAFLASAESTDSLQAIMVGNAASTKVETREELKTKWSTASTTQSLEGPMALKQSAWDKPLLDKIVADLLDRQPEQISQARLKPISAPYAGDWLLALPIASCGLRLDDETVRVAAGLRLGVPLCEPHGCPCGAPVAADGHHGLSWPLGPGRFPRHATLNDFVFRSLVRAGYPSTKEPTGLLRTDGRRPDGQTLFPWRGD